MKSPNGPPPPLLRFFGYSEDARAFSARFNNGRAYPSVRKNGDTFFILGSGPQVNRYSTQEWDHIRENTSLGVNFFLLHDFVPDFHISEALNDEIFSLFLDLYREKSELYEDMPVMLNSHHLKSIDPILLRSAPKGFYSYTPFFLHQCSRSTISPLLWLLGVIARLKSNPFDACSHISGSISIGLSLALALGFKKVVFSGVDLRGNNNFYDDYQCKIASALNPALARYRDKLREGFGSVSGHLTNVPTNKYPIMKALELINESRPRHMRAQLFADNPESLLAERYPVYEFPR